MAHAEGLDLTGAQLGLVAGLLLQGDVALPVVGVQHRPAAFGKQPGGVCLPGVDIKLAGDAAHGQATHPGTVPDALQRGAGGEGTAQADLVGEARDLGHAQIAHRLVHGLDPFEQPEQGRVDRAHHRRGQGHVGFDQGGQRVDGTVLIGHQQGQLDQGARTSGQVDVEVAQLRIDGHDTLGDGGDISLGAFAPCREAQMP